jgi:putative phosphoesterase
VKKIGLLSDTHGDIPSSIFKHFSDVDEIWHAGDIGNIQVLDTLKAFKPLRAVHGNIDDHTLRLECPEYLAFELEGVRVLITHIAGKPGKYVEKALHLIEEHRPKLFICGHSHIALVKMDPHFKMLWINPGAAGKKGFHAICTMMRFQLQNGRIEQLELIELGKRNQLDNSNEI